MLARNRYELQVGVVFTIVAALLVIGVFWAKRFSPTPPAMQIEVLFPSVGGLLRGDRVLVSGYELGTVRGIALTPTGVKTTVSLDREIVLNEDYRIDITIMNFTGEMGINISPGNGPPLPKPYGVLEGQPPLDLAMLAQPAIEAMNSVQQIADTLRSILPPLVAASQGVINRTDLVLAELGSEIVTGREALAATLADVQDAMTAAQHMMSNLDERFGAAAHDAERMFGSLTATSDSLRRMIAKIDTAEGTLGRLISDSTLYVQLTAATAKLDSAATSIDSLATDVRRNPRRYVRFSLF